MPRKYKPKDNVRKRVPYDPETLKNAVKAVQDGENYKCAARKFSVNVMTLKRMCRKKITVQPGYKNRQIFSEAQECELSNYLMDMSKMYYGLSVNQLCKLAHQYANINKIPYPSNWDTNQEAGRDWYRGFLDRNQSISLRTPEPTSMARATAFNRQKKENAKKTKRLGLLFPPPKKGDDTSSDSDECPSLKSSSGGELEYRSDDEAGKTFEPIKKEVGEYVVVTYNDILYPGQIKELSVKGATITAMQKNGRLWKWPAKEDVIFYEWNEILGHLPEPKKFSKTRDIYSVPLLE